MVFSGNIRHLGPKLGHLNRALLREINLQLENIELTAIQAFILHYLETCERKTVCQKNIERRFSLSHPTVSGILSRLEAKGYVTTREDEVDRRRKLVMPTERAASADPQIYEMICRAEDKMFAGFSENEILLLTSLIDRAAHNLKSEKNEKEETQFD